MSPGNFCLACMDADAVDGVCPRCGEPVGWKPKSSLHLTPGLLLQSRYLVGRALGHGGFGITYLAWDQEQGRKLAIKEYMPNGVAARASGDPRVGPISDAGAAEYLYGLDKFIEEAQMLARFQQYPNIASVVAFFKENGTAYLVMEFLDGVTFEEFLNRRGGRISWEKALRVMQPVLEALSTLHAEDILHRDVSPDNIFITKSGEVRLIDFGAARHALRQRSRKLSVILKEGYAPEEQYRTSGRQGPWTDVYAAAATLYQAITGQIPPPALDRQAKDSILLPYEELGSDIPPHSEIALMKALSIRASDRYQSVEDFWLALVGAPAAPAAPAAAASPDSVITPIPKTLTPAPYPPSGPRATPAGFVPAGRPLTPLPPAPTPKRPKWLLPAIVVAVGLALLAIWLAAPDNFF